MICKDCSYKEFHDGNGRPGRYYCLHEDTGLEPREVLQLKKNAVQWIPVTERLPDPESYILVSFENYILPDIATYRVDEDGSGAFYPGDEDYTYLSAGVFVNAWMPLPEPYREE